MNEIKVDEVFRNKAILCLYHQMGWRNDVIARSFGITVEEVEKIILLFS